jgi:acid phosphatase class B
MKQTIIFDLDGTLALIDKRRAISTKDNGKMDWDKFFDPKNIDLDQPNIPVIKTLQMFMDNGFKIVIFSGRSDRTFNATTKWLMNNQIMWHQLQMRPEDKHFWPDNKLKQFWLDTLIDKDDVFAVFDDRDQVVDMWRQNGLTTFQVAEGDF